MEWEYKYCEYKGLEFIIHYDDELDEELKEELLFDVDYKGELFLLDLGDKLEVVT